MNAAHLQASQSGSVKTQAPDTKGSSGTDERLFLSNLANKPQNHTITNLYLSAAIASDQTNRYLQSCAKIHHLPSSVVFDYFQVKERLLAHSEISASLPATSAFTSRLSRLSLGNRPELHGGY